MRLPGAAVTTRATLRLLGAAELGERGLDLVEGDPPARHFQENGVGQLGQSQGARAVRIGCIEDDQVAPLAEVLDEVGHLGRHHQVVEVVGPRTGTEHRQVAHGRGERLVGVDLTAQQVRQARPSRSRDGASPVSTSTASWLARARLVASGIGLQVPPPRPVTRTTSGRLMSSERTPARSRPRSSGVGSREPRAASTGTSRGSRSSGSRTQPARRTLLSPQASPRPPPRARRGSPRAGRCRGAAALDVRRSHDLAGVDRSGIEVRRLRTQLAEVIGSRMICCCSSSAFGEPIGGAGPAPSPGPGGRRTAAGSAP